MSLWVYNLFWAQLGGSALSWAHSLVWGMSCCWLTGFTWGCYGNLALPQCLSFSSTTQVCMTKTEMQEKASYRMQSPVQAFACIVSANILLGKASHKAEPSVKEWGRFQWWERIMLQNLMEKEWVHGGKNNPSHTYIGLSVLCYQTS